MENRKSIQIKITLSSKEYEILQKFSEHQKKPIASCLTSFIREACIFDVIDGVNEAMDKLVEIKNVSINDVVSSVSKNLSVK